jgi:hypothetical protein
VELFFEDTDNNEILNFKNISKTMRALTVNARYRDRLTEEAGFRVNSKT